MTNRKDSTVSEMSTDSTSLISRVIGVCRRLAPHGWRDLLAHHGLNTEAPDLSAELARPLPSIDRSIEGFHDFATEGRRGIEPRRPAYSLLFHALASPQVIYGINGKPLTEFPRPSEIEAVENYVYGVRPPSVQDLRVEADDAPFAIVVFAQEYRPAIDTVHQKHADMCFSRAGITRVGTYAHKYLSDARGYLPMADDDDHAIRVLPCRYAAYIAAQYNGAKGGFGPLRFREGGELTIGSGGEVGLTRSKSDVTRQFWVPIHKLFNGAECIRGVNIEFKLKAHHVSQKLRRVHVALLSEGHDTGWCEPAISRPPFVFTSGIADFSDDPNDGEGLLVPVVHHRLVNLATQDGKPVTLKVPTGAKTFSSSLNIEAKPSGARRAPEYVHVRHALGDNGQQINLNQEPEIRKLVEKGGYRALHYIDFTGDGWIQAECKGLSLQIPRSIAAYSMVSPPHFYPAVLQQDLMDWWKQSAPPDVAETIWPTNPGPPRTLAEERYAANLTLTEAKFDENDDTMTAIVGFRDAATSKPTQIDPVKNPRASTLPDGAAGVFAPGWDTSIDRTDERDPSDDGRMVLPGITHLSNYGLGSPFPEDAKLCAALSSYWPAAAPDVTRTFEPGKYATATPMTDDVLGQNGGSSWDGVKGPTLSTAYPNEVEYNSIDYGDYVESALNNKFSLSVIGQTTSDEYDARTLIMARVYKVLGATTREEKTKWAVFSFSRANPDSKEVKDATAKTKTTLDPVYAYRFQIFEHKGTRVSPTAFNKSLVKFDDMKTILADPQVVLVHGTNDEWEAHAF